MKKQGAISIGLSVTMFISGCELATTGDQVGSEEQAFVLNLIRDQGYRCQRVSEIVEKATVQGWRVTCFAEDFGTDRKNWPYEVTKLPRGWVVSPWKINSELPKRCQAYPDRACAAPG